MKPRLSFCWVGLAVLVANCGNETVESTQNPSNTSREKGGAATTGHAGEGGDGDIGGNASGQGGDGDIGGNAGEGGDGDIGGNASGQGGDGDGASARSGAGGVAGETGSGGAAAGTTGFVCVPTNVDTPLPRITFVQDLSSSMRGQWQPVADTMVSLINDIGEKAQLGLVPFSSVYIDNVAEIAEKYAKGGVDADTWFVNFYRLNDADCNISDSSITIPVIGNASTVSAAYRSVIAERMVGGTPTYLAITKAQHVLVEHAPTDGSRGYAFLITDGDPNCESPTADRIADVETAISELASHEVKTYVFAYRYYQAFALQRWAIAGRTERYYSAENASELRAALAQILRTLVTCD